MNSLIELDIALARLGGNRPLFADVAARFIDETPRMLEEIHQCVASQNLPAAAAVLHQLKAIAATVGHTALADIAAGLEWELKSEARVECRALDLFSLDATYATGVTQLKSIIAAFGSAAIPEPPNGHVSQRKPLVLIVDDHLATLSVLSAILSPEYSICVAINGTQALEMCRDVVPDVMLLDVSMPGINGHQTCAMAKADPALAEIPILMVTSLNEPSEEVRAFEAGAADFISKPFHEKIVRARIRNQIALKTQTEMLRTFASSDGLTGLANRRRFDEALDQEWRRCEREANTLALLLLDVDFFKAFNDQYGHPAGDACLQKIANVLKRFSRRPGDLVARYGGEEIAILLPGADRRFAFQSANAARLSVEALAIEHRGQPDGRPHVTLSVGVATARPGVEPGTAADLVALSDRALYDAKHHGRNMVRTSWRASKPVPPTTPHLDFPHRAL